MSVANGPGQIAFAVTPLPAHSSASTRVRLTTPAFDAAYGARPGRATEPRMEPRLMTRHQPWLHSWLRGPPGPRAVRRVESRGRQPHARARARVGRQRRDGERDLSGSVCDGHESAVAREPGDVSGIHPPDSDGTMGRVARAGGRGRIPRIGCGVVRDRQCVVRGWRMDGEV